MPVRPLLDGDVPACADLVVRAFAGPPWNEVWDRPDAIRRLEDMIRTPGAVGRACFDGDALVGFALGHRQRFQAADHFFLQELCVAPEQQRRGWGSALLQSLHDDLPDVSAWSLLTARDGTAADFYRRHGYRAAGRMALFVRP